MVWLAAGDADLRASFCTPTVLLCSPTHAAEWAERHGNAASVLDLATAASQGASDWAASAAAVQRLEAADADPTATDLTEVEYVGGPRDAEHETLTETPPVLRGVADQNRRSVRCADDGALRYVWQWGEGTTARPS